jgi:hypothetical protein
LIAVVVPSAAFVVATHGWLVLAPVPATVAAVEMIRWWRRPERAGHTKLVFGSLACAALVLAAIRPWAFTLLSGDAGSQAQERGYVEHAPWLLGALVAIGLVLLSGFALRHRFGGAELVPFAALMLVSVVAFHAAGWQLELYYPQKVIWAVFVLLAPLAVAGWVRSVTFSRRGSTVSPVGGKLVVLVLVAAAMLTLSRSGFLPLGLTHSSARSTSLALAGSAIASSGSHQLLIVRVNGPDEDRLTSMWGRAARDIRGLPAVDVSEIDFDGITPERMCEIARARGVAAEIATRTPDGLIRRNCRL